MGWGALSPPLSLALALSRILSPLIFLPLSLALLLARILSPPIFLPLSLALLLALPFALFALLFALFALHALIIFVCIPEALPCRRCTNHDIARRQADQHRDDDAYLCDLHSHHSIGPLPPLRVKVQYFHWSSLGAGYAAETVWG